MGYDIYFYIYFSDTQTILESSKLKFSNGSCTKNRACLKSCDPFLEIVDPFIFVVCPMAYLKTSV